MKKLFFFITTLVGFSFFHAPLFAQPVCNKSSIPSLPDVRITSVSEESAPVNYCKVAGVIGPEIHFELHTYLLS